MSYARTEPRTTLRCTVMVTPQGNGSAVLGEVLDVSSRGAAVVIPTRVSRNAPVTLLLDRDAIPDPNREGGIVSLKATVVSIAPAGHDGAGHALFRHGLRFTALPPSVVVRLEAATRYLARGTGPNATLPPPAEPPIGRDLAQTPRGRERLYQHALACIAAGRLADAREPITWAAMAAPRNVFYRAILHRIAAELALAEGGLTVAGREIAQALVHRPDDVDLLALKGRVDQAVETERRRSGIIGRIFRRS